MESTIFFPKKTVRQKKGTVCYLSMTALWLITNNMFWHLPYSAYLMGLYPLAKRLIRQQSRPAKDIAAGLKNMIITITSFRKCQNRLQEERTSAGCPRQSTASAKQSVLSIFRCHASNRHKLLDPTGTGTRRCLKKKWIWLKWNPKVVPAVS